MIDAPRLLADLRNQLKRLEDDLRARVAEVPELNAALAAEWQQARDAERTSETLESWAEQVITQAGVQWLLSCVFLRFIEDNQLVERPWLSGARDSGRLALAWDRHEAYFRARPLESDREYLLAAFREAGALPGLTTFFDESHNPVFRLGISGDAAMAMRQFWQDHDPDTGALLHDFTDAAWNTRFLGDLYQDLSEDAKKRYALLQTPEFMEEFILDRTLTPAIDEFGFRDVRLLDPTCGSGHFLLGAFHRLVNEWARNEPGRNARDVVQKALDAVAGVDLNPFAVAIARFRLLVAALNSSGVQRLAEAPNFRTHVVIGDSLLHGVRFGLTSTEAMFEGGEHYASTGLAHAYASEDLDEVQRILGRQYHAVVGNPPYITVKDKALNAAYRARYVSCHMKYSLGAPFTERFFELAITGNGQPAGFVGLITANSFMKREFGSKLIEEVLPRLDLTHVVDTSGAYIPGHGTPTVLLFGRHRTPVGEAVRTVMGIKGEPNTPHDPAQGLVWSAVVGQIDLAGSESEFVSVTDTPRPTFAKHPWSIGGGGAAEMKELIEQDRLALESIAESAGITSFTLEDNLFVHSECVVKRHRVEQVLIRPMVNGDELRDWTHTATAVALFPYRDDYKAVDLLSYPAAHRFMWMYRTGLANNKMFGAQTKVEAGLEWWEYGRLTTSKFLTPLSIAFGEIATHNHFVLDRGGKVFNRTAPVIKLRAGSSEDEHLGLLGLLNSSVACFWFQQVCHNKGGPGGGSSKDEKWHDFYAFNATKVADFPIVESRPVDLARRLDRLASQRSAALPGALLANQSAGGAAALPTRSDLDAACDRATSLGKQMVAWQEELDWHCYAKYGVLPGDCAPEDVVHAAPPELTAGERAFEIILARKLAEGALQTRWFEWLGIEPTIEIPTNWPEDYRRVVARRIELIESNRNIGLVESMNCKRRWEITPWPMLEHTKLHSWLLDRMEAPSLWSVNADAPPQLSSVNRLADALREDAGFMHVAALYAGRDDFDVSELVRDLVSGESVPFLPVLRYKESGLRKRAQWEATWALQRREDTGENVGSIPVPPDYKSSDFLKSDYWRMRGGLDVPKERWISYPGCERGADGSLPIAWAGWSHLQQATGLAAYYLAMKETEGWEPARLQPLLAGLLDLLPWLKQWHNQLNPVYGERMGDYYEGFVRDEARGLGVTLNELKAWRPTAAALARRRRARGAAQ